MLTLLTFPASFSMPSHSPFCVKAMALLNLSGLPWRAEYLDDPRPMPMGRLPVLRDGERLVPDSAWIGTHLEATGADLWAGQGPAARHEAQPFIRMAESVLYQSLVHDRWLDDRCWSTVRDTFFGSIPPLVRGMVTRGLRKKVRLALNATGVAQFSEQERISLLRPDLDAIEAKLWNGPYLQGDAPTAADAATAPVLAMLEALPGPTALRAEIRGREAICAYIARMRPVWEVPEAPAG